MHAICFALAFLCACYFFLISVPHLSAHMRTFTSQQYLLYASKRKANTHVKKQLKNGEQMFCKQMQKSKTRARLSVLFFVCFKCCFSSVFYFVAALNTHVVPLLLWPCRSQRLILQYNSLHASAVLPLPPGDQDRFWGTTGKTVRRLSALVAVGAPLGHLHAKVLPVATRTKSASTRRDSGSAWASRGRGVETRGGQRGVVWDEGPVVWDIGGVVGSKKRIYDPDSC